MAGRRSLKTADDAARARQAIIRRASLYTWIFFAAGMLVAVLGAAFVAFLLHFTGLPFARSWLVLSALIVVVAALVTAVQSHRRKTK